MLPDAGHSGCASANEMTKIKDRLRHARILLIDDNRGDAMLTKLAFKQASIEINFVVAETAEQGLSILRQEGNFSTAPRPDIILLDLNLPLMHGHEFLSTVKADPGLRGIPVVILTSSSSDQDVATSYDRYANGHITKPFSAEAFTAVAEKIEQYWFDLMQCPPDGIQVIQRTGSA